MRVKMGEIWLALRVAAVFIFTALISEESGIRLYLMGSKEHPDFQVNPTIKNLVLIAIVAAVILLAFAQISLRGVKTNYTQYVAVEKQKAEDETKRLEAEERRRREELQKAELQARIDTGIAAAEERMTRLAREGYSDIRTVRDDENLRITEGQRSVEEGRLSRAVVRVEVDNRYGEEKLHVVFHIFENSTFWKFDRVHQFEDGRGAQLDFIGAVENSSLSVTLATYDALIGVGLMSNSRAQPASVADDRVKLLCAVLIPYAKRIDNVLGLSLDSYTQQPFDSIQYQQPKQRPLL